MSFRKRNRSSGEEDFLPLSKKINNLHINNWGNIENQGDQLMTWGTRTEQWLASQQSIANGGRSEEESLDCSLFENAQESGFQIYETDSNKFFDKDACGSSSHINCKSNSPEEGQNAWSMVYNPDLSIDENPYYYENNKLLFELYVERLRRGSYGN